MAKGSFRCRLVTPTGSLVDDQVSYASIPAWDGLMGVLPGRAPMLGRLGTGELRLDFPDGSKGAGGARVFAVDGGFVRMEQNQLTILAERAIASEAIVETEVEGELRKLEDKPGMGAADKTRQARDRAYATLRLGVARRRQGI